MAKKKRSQRKRNLAYARQQGNKPPIETAELQTQTENEAGAELPQPGKSKVMSVVQIPYLRRDIRKIMILATACVGLELILWFLLQHTSFGVHVFGG